MKKFWNQHRTGIAIGVISAVVLAVAVHVILILCGFHFLYSPEQHNNWDAVSGVATWAGIFVSSLLSVAAIWYAIQVPKKIAARQDKIELFSLRIQVTDMLGKIFSQFERLLFYNKQISVNSLECQATTFFNAVKDVDMTLSNLIERLGLTYQYIFPQPIADDIKMIRIKSDQISRYVIQLDNAIDSTDFPKTLAEAEQRKSVKADDTLTHILAEIEQICSEILSLQKKISLETGKYMDLREL